MDAAEITTIVTNAIVLVFVGWAFFVRREVDKRLDKISKAFRDATDVFVKTASWERTAKEVEAMEAALRKRHENELKNVEEEHLENFQKTAEKSIDQAADYAILRTAVGHFVPDHLKAMVWIVHVEQGYSPEALFVKCWETRQELIDEARSQLRAAEERRKRETEEPVTENQKNA